MAIKKCRESLQTCRLRVLVVDDEVKVREELLGLLTSWGYLPCAAAGVGDALIADAERQARERRCHLALIDMRLRDNYDRSDRSGLELVARLRPTVSIILSGFGDPKAVRDALRQYGASDFVGKEDHPDALRKTIEDAAQEFRACQHGTEVIWTDGSASRTVRDMLFPERSDVPEDEAEDLIGKLFPKAQRVVLAPIADETSAVEQLSAPRRRSRVFRVAVDNRGAVRVVKLAHVDKIEREITNYDNYVKDQLLGDFRPVKEAAALLWDMGALAYSHIGNSSLGAAQGPDTLTNHYREATSAEQSIRPLRHFFDPTNWGQWYKRDVTVINGSLFDAYDSAWLGALSEQLAEWVAHEPTRSYPGLGLVLPNPTHWITRHRMLCNQVARPRQAVTHGDLHGDNLFVDAEHCWPIDFERTGTGPLLRDFVELIQDVLTRIARFEATDLAVFYELATAICAPTRADEKLQASPAIREHPEAYKAFEFTQEVLCLAYERTQYDDRRELLWGLLLNCIFVTTLLDGESLRRTCTLLLASTICARLERWGTRQPWPPVLPTGSKGRKRPPAHPARRQHDDTAPRSSPLFSQGHALLIGVGRYQRVGLTVLETANDAEQLAKVLCDPDLAAYPPTQVRLLSDAQATKRNILDAFDELTTTLAGQQSTVLILFAGHGRRVGQDFSLVPYDYDPSHPAASSIDGPTLRQKIDALASRAQKVLLLLNCCYAGGIGTSVLDEEATLTSPPQDFYNTLAIGASRVVITAARPTQRAGAVSGVTAGNTVFGAHLLAGLRGQAPGYGPTVTIFNLFQYLSQQVPQDAQMLTDPVTKASLVQHPEFYGRHITEDFALTLRPATKLSAIYS